MLNLLGSNRKSKTLNSFALPPISCASAADSKSIDSLNKEREMITNKGWEMHRRVPCKWCSVDHCQKTLQCWLPCKPDMAVTTVTGSGWGYKLVRIEYFWVTKERPWRNHKKGQKTSNWPRFTRENIDAMIFIFKDELLICVRRSRRRGVPLRVHHLTSWGSSTSLRRKDERPININLPPRPPFQALKYLIVLGQLCCFVGRACGSLLQDHSCSCSMKALSSGTTLPKERASPKNSGFFFHHRQLKADRAASLCLTREEHKSSMQRQPECSLMSSTRPQFSIKLSVSFSFIYRCYKEGASTTHR